MSFSGAAANIRCISLKTPFAMVASGDFKAVIKDLCNSTERFRKHLSQKEDYSRYVCWIAKDKTHGFAVGPDFELTNVFSIVQGGGRACLDFATGVYEELHLNCYAGWREKFYAGHGFCVQKREANLDAAYPGDLAKPDVVYMRWRRPPIHVPVFLRSLSNDG